MGFADAVNTATWAARTGAGPATQVTVPSYVAVLTTVAATQSGNSVAAPVVRTVVVAVDPSCSVAPGKTCAGVVVATA
jgi:hypothetical protein